MPIAQGPATPGPVCLLGPSSLLRALVPLHVSGSSARCFRQCPAPGKPKVQLEVSPASLPPSSPPHLSLRPSPLYLSRFQSPSLSLRVSFPSNSGWPSPSQPRSLPQTTAARRRRSASPLVHFDPLPGMQSLSSLEAGCRLYHDARNPSQFLTLSFAGNYIGKNSPQN